MVSSNPTQLAVIDESRALDRRAELESRIRANLGAQLFEAQTARVPDVEAPSPEMPRSGARAHLSRARAQYSGQLAGRGFNRAARRALAKKVRLAN